MRNQKGYTLIELLATVMILAIIAAIAVIGIGRVIEKSKEQAFAADALALKSAAALYVKDQWARTGAAPENISYALLYEEGMLEPIQDPFTGELLSPSNESYAVANGDKIVAVCLRGQTKALCSHKKGDRVIEGPVPIAELKAENVKNK